MKANGLQEGPSPDLPILTMFDHVGKISENHIFSHNLGSSAPNWVFSTVLESKFKYPTIRMLSL